MASVGHVAVGLAAGRLRAAPEAGPTKVAGLMLFYVALSLLPDLDVIAFLLGIPYRAPFGHRGALHSLAFAGCVGGCVALVQKLRHRQWLGPALFAAMTVASHGILDALTDGGLGVAFFWPFTNHRYFFPWNPIPVAPIGWRVLTSRSLFVGLTELWMFAPLAIYAFWPRYRKGSPVKVKSTPMGHGMLL